MAVAWLRRLVFRTVLHPERLRLAALKLAATVPDEKRSGATMARLVVKDHLYATDSVIGAVNPLRQARPPPPPVSADADAPAPPPPSPPLAAPPSPPPPPLPASPPSVVKAEPGHHTSRSRLRVAARFHAHFPPSVVSVSTRHATRPADGDPSLPHSLSLRLSDSQARFLASVARVFKKPDSAAARALLGEVI